MQSKIILIKIFPSLIIASAVLAGLLMGAKIISNSITRTNSEYMRHSERIIVQASEEVTKAITTHNRFQFAMDQKHEKANWHEGWPTSYFLFDSYTGIIHSNRNGDWYVDSKFEHKDMMKSINSSEEWRKIINDID